MIVGLVQSTMALNLVAVICSVGGITVGLLGMTQYRRNK